MDQTRNEADKQAIRECFPLQGSLRGKQACASPLDTVVLMVAFSVCVERHPWACFMFHGYQKQRSQPTACIPVLNFEYLSYHTFYRYLEQR